MNIVEYIPLNKTRTMSEILGNGKESRDRIKARIKEVRDNIKEIELKAEPLKKELSVLLTQIENNAKSRVQACLSKQDKFEQDELTYAAVTRCTCGAGMAYPNDIGMHGSWMCSAILSGTADTKVMHSSDLPFAFHSVKSENQTSALGETTRPPATDIHNS